MQRLKAGLLGQCDRQRNYLGAMSVWSGKGEEAVTETVVLGCAYQRISHLIFEVQKSLTVLNNCSNSALQPVIALTSCLTAISAPRRSHTVVMVVWLDARSDVEKDLWQREQGEGYP